MFIFRYSLFLLLLFNLKGYSLNFPDFYDDDGQLLEIPNPPFFDYAYDYCAYHWMNRPKKASGEYDYDNWKSEPGQLIPKIAKNALAEALKASHCHLKIPPPYYWRGEKTYGFRDRWMNNWKNSFFNRFSEDYQRVRLGERQDCVRYTEYNQKFEYLFYWFRLCYGLERNSIEKQIKKKEEELKVAEERRKNILADEIRSNIAYLEKEIQLLEEFEYDSFSCLYSSLENITELFLLLYSYCIEVDPHPTSIYERGRIFFDQGDTIGFLTDINALIANGFTQTPEINFQIGKAYNDANQYNQAIKILSEALKEDPEHKEAYFERAVAYFETGRFDLALSDYIFSDFQPTLIDPNNERHFHYLKLSKGLVTGILKGGIDSTVDFVPSLFSTVYGIGKGLWVFSSDPVGISVEMVSSCIGCVEFIKENLSIELIAALVPELRECIDKWDNLDEEKKGYYIGYVVGRYGVDMLAWGGGMRAVKLFKDLRRANTILTFENSYLSSKNLQEILAASEEFHQCRTNYIAKCKIDVANQRKHIPGSNNYKEKTSDLLISLSELEAETKPKMGMGLPARGKFGEHGYQEFIEYDKVVGIYYTQEGNALSTKCAKIHYNKKGEYHVVPSHPDIFKFKRNGG